MDPLFSSHRKRRKRGQQKWRQMKMEASASASASVRGHRDCVKLAGRERQLGGGQWAQFKWSEFLLLRRAQLGSRRSHLASLAIIIHFFPLSLFISHLKQVLALDWAEPARARARSAHANLARKALFARRGKVVAHIGGKHARGEKQQ